MQYSLPILQTLPGACTQKEIVIKYRGEYLMKLFNA